STSASRLPQQPPHPRLPRRAQTRQASTIPRAFQPRMIRWQVETLIATGSGSAPTTRLHRSSGARSRRVCQGNILGPAHKRRRSARPTVAQEVGDARRAAAEAAAAVVATLEQQPPVSPRPDPGLSAAAEKVPGLPPGLYPSAAAPAVLKGGGSSAGG